MFHQNLSLVVAYQEVRFGIPLPGQIQHHADHTSADRKPVIQVQRLQALTISIWGGHVRV
jgi:hypothetical protein